MRARLAWAMASVSLFGVALASAGTPTPLSHTDNGRRIFLHGTTSAGRVVENSHGMEGVGCAMCHGPDGRGGMMHGIPAPDITYGALTDPNGHEHAFMARRHSPFNRETIRSEEHTSELQSLAYLVCRLLLEKKKKKKTQSHR